MSKSKRTERTASAAAPSITDLEDAKIQVTLATQQVRDRQFVAAHKTARDGQKLYPGLTTLSGEDAWAQLLTLINLRLERDGIAIPVSAPPASPVSATPVQAPVSAAPVVPAATAEPESVDPMTVPGEGPAFVEDGALGTVIIHHTPEKGTWLTGTEKGDGSLDVIKGQRWSWARAGKVWHLGNSRDYAADMIRIGWMALALRRAGFNAYYEIDNGNAPVKETTAYSRARHYEVRGVALRQQQVTADPASVKPVSGPREFTRPVSAAPASAAPVSAAPKSAPRPPVSAAPRIAVPNYTAMTTDELLALVLTGDITALATVRTRMAATATAITATPEAPKPVTVLRPATAPEPVQLPAQVLIEGNAAEIWLTSDVKGQAFKRAATELRGAFNRGVTHRFGERGARPEVSVFRAPGAFRVIITAPEGVDVRDIAAKALTVAGSGRVAGVGAVRDRGSLNH